MQVWNVVHAACWKCRTQKFATNLPSTHHHTTLSGYVFATKACINNRKKLVKQQYLLHMPHDMANCSPLMAEIGWRVWGTRANFNQFRVFASLVHRHCSAEVSRTLHDVWPSPGLVRHRYISGASCPPQNFARCKLHFASKCCFLLYWQHCCMHSSSVHQANFAAFSSHLYLAGRASHSQLIPLLQLACLLRTTWFYCTQEFTHTIYYTVLAIDVLKYGLFIEGVWMQEH